VCVFVPRALNAFWSVPTANRNGLYTGVTQTRSGNKFRATIRIDSYMQCLGYFDTAEEARSVYMAAKEAEAHRWYRRLVDKEFAVDSRVIEHFKTWTHT
jgi:hypothetical protein